MSETLAETMVQFVFAGRKKMPPADASICHVIGSDGSGRRCSRGAAAEVMQNSRTQERLSLAPTSSYLTWSLLNVAFQTLVMPWVAKRCAVDILEILTVNITPHVGIDVLGTHVKDVSGSFELYGGPVHHE